MVSASRAHGPVHTIVLAILGIGLGLGAPSVRELASCQDYPLLTKLAFGTQYVCEELRANGWCQWHPSWSDVGMRRSEVTQAVCARTCADAGHATCEGFCDDDDDLLAYIDQTSGQRWFESMGCADAVVAHLPHHNATDLSAHAVVVACGASSSERLGFSVKCHGDPDDDDGDWEERLRDEVGRNVSALGALVEGVASEISALRDELGRNASSLLANVSSFSDEVRLDLEAFAERVARVERDLGDILPGEHRDAQAVMAALF